MQTARYIYNECDGTEYESSGNFFDLRFVPDDVKFDDEPRYPLLLMAEIRQ